jgi:SAM-dependent methyltransferase
VGLPVRILARTTRVSSSANTSVMASKTLSTSPSASFSTSGGSSIKSVSRLACVDYSETLISEAHRRWTTSGLPVSFRVGDAHALPFPDASFDACRAERVFVHLQDPARAFAEMVRVSKPGARVAVFDMDADTLIVDAPNRRVTRAILDLRADAFRSQGWIGRRLRALYVQHAMTDIDIGPATCMFLDYDFANEFWSLGRTAALARDRGLISAAEEADWVSSLRDAGAAGRFFLSVTAFLACGKKP